jgi:beta-phosphoglucomutase-like phosphatase (HAD superfamily)
LGYLEFYLSNQDVKVGKPDPEIYSMAMQRLGLLPQECLIVEDNENGIQAARASGAWVMEVDEVEEVNYQNIAANIKGIEGSMT